jgi:hypothetical protein
MGPLRGSIIRLAVGRDAVQRNERFARPQACESLGRHAIASGRRVVHFNGVDAAPASDDNEVAPIDPDERWEWKLRDFRGIPSNGEDAKTGERRRRFQIVERGAVLIRCGQATKTVRRGHSEPGEPEKIRQRGGTAIVERCLQPRAALRDEPRPAPLEPPPRHRAERLERIPAGDSDASNRRRGEREHRRGKHVCSATTMARGLFKELRSQAVTLRSWRHMSGGAPSRRSHRRGMTCVPAVTAAGGTIPPGFALPCNVVRR